MLLAHLHVFCCYFGLVWNIVYFAFQLLEIHPWVCYPQGFSPMAKKISTKIFAIFFMQIQHEGTYTHTHTHSKPAPQSRFCYKRTVHVSCLTWGQSDLYTKLTGLPHQPQRFQPMSRESSTTKDRWFFIYLLCFFYKLENRVHFFFLPNKSAKKHHPVSQSPIPTKLEHSGSKQQAFTQPYTTLQGTRFSHRDHLTHSCDSGTAFSWQTGNGDWQRTPHVAR